MNYLRQFIACSIVSAMLIGNTQSVYAEGPIKIAETTKASLTETITPGIDDIEVQLDSLYKEVGKELDINYMYVKLIHMLAGGDAVYADRRPNIYSENTVDTLKAPFDIPGTSTKYSKSAPWAFCPDTTISRPSKYYLPDAAYNVTRDIVNIMNKRYKADRGEMQNYFDALKNDVRNNILFCEAITEYSGGTASEVNSIYKVYEKLLYEKDANENIIESNGDGTYKFKADYQIIFEANGIMHTDALALILSFDKNLSAYEDPNSIKETLAVPYKRGYTSRENMMIAASSLVGKVRYVWGGGHLTTGNIDGINPAWLDFMHAYDKSLATGIEVQEGYKLSIIPGKSYCPMHGETDSELGCLLESETIYSAEDYAKSRETVFASTIYSDEKFKTLLSGAYQVPLGMTSHRLDGLDCSGYTSWVYNQVDKSVEYGGPAGNFIDTPGMESLDITEPMLPGDVLSWKEHIVLTVGTLRQNSNTYIMVEASPNMVKYGVLVSNTTTSEDRETALRIAKDANKFIGNLPDTEPTHLYNIDVVGRTLNEETGELSEETTAMIGRRITPFIDEDTYMSEGKTIKSMDALDIIKHTIKKMPDEYLSGKDTYTGETTFIDTEAIQPSTLPIGSITPDEVKLEVGDRDAQE